MDEWIDVHDRLPDKEGYYLVSLGNAWDGTGFGCIASKKKIYDSFVRISQFKNGQFYHGMVAAWMPKPKPYMGRESEAAVL